MDTSIGRLALAGAMISLLAAVGGAAHAGGEIKVPFNASNFDDTVDPNTGDALSSTITNPYWPLSKGKTFTYRGVSKDGCTLNDVEVTDTIRSLAGVDTRQIHDQVYEDIGCTGTRGFRSEDTLDWYGQDKAGNIWYFGEFSQAYTPGQPPSTEGSWEAGQDGALPGIVILAHPTAGDFYQQEFAGDVAHDMAKVLRTNAKVTLIFANSIAPDTYSGCMETKEWSPLEPGAVEHKYYCKGVGLVLINELQSSTVRTELIQVVGP
jgi:hypothetical protein